MEHALETPEVASSAFTAEFTLSLTDSTTFSRLSGDCNPLHIDPVAARRLSFGGSVTHGVHLFARTLDELASRGMFLDREPAALSGSFDNPVLTGTPVTLRVNVNNEKIRFEGMAAGRRAYSGSVELRTARTRTFSIDDANFAPAQPQDRDVPSIGDEGNAPLRIDRALLGTLFPALARLPAVQWLADLFATTQIVGMICPGLHSIYSSFKLRAIDPPGARRSMHYRVNGVERRFNLLRMQVDGACLAGTVEAFVRSRPVAQRSIKEVASVIAPDAFSGHRALIVGGSRGLGELVAKVLLAGGADVTITYARGKADAESLREQAEGLGRVCNIQRLDALSLQQADEWPGSTRFSHVYFFASPLIARNVGPWNESLFQQFAAMYVTALARLAEALLTRRSRQEPSLRFLYPSTIFVTRPESGFAEYVAAKAAGEALCDQLQRRFGATFLKPRLPRMRTDQTSALAAAEAPDPLPFILEVVRDMHA